MPFRIAKPTIVKDELIAELSILKCTLKHPNDIYSLFDSSENDAMFYNWSDLAVVSQGNIFLEKKFYPPMSRVAWTISKEMFQMQQ